MAYHLTAEQIANQLGGARPAGEGFSCRCPAHEDKNPSLWIKQREGGGLHVKCKAGCHRESVEAVLKSRGLWPQTGARKSDFKDAKRRERRGSEIAEFIVPIPPDTPAIDWRELGRDSPTVLHTYCNAEGEPLGYVARWSKLDGTKDIRPVSFARTVAGRMEWMLSAWPGPSTLYGLERLASRPESPILLVEGEKAVDAGQRDFPDYVVMSWRGGAGATDKADFSPLRGRRVVLWPDADEAGLKAMASVAAILHSNGASDVAMVELPPDLPKGWDIADPCPEGFTKDHLLTLARPVEPTSAPDTAPEVDADKAMLRPHVVSAADLQALEVEPREPIIEPFMVTSSLSMLFAPRGVGKTFLALSLGISLSEGTNFLTYEVLKPWRTLYFDGEMPLADLKARIAELAPSPPPLFDLIPSETLFREGQPINLHREDDQARIFALLDQLKAENRNPDVLIFDNLSSLSGGVNENDNSELDALLRFLMRLRHLGYAVLLIHHAGKSGDQRGASRREDIMDTVLSLKKPDDDEGGPAEGAHAVLHFTKVRGKRPVPDELEISLMYDGERLRWAFQKVQTKDSATNVLKAIAEQGPQKQSELATKMNLSAGRISQLLTKLRKAGLVCAGSLELTTEGKEKVLESYPELHGRLAKQEDMFAGNCPI
ncbi:MAG: AAA family ATPase [Brevundimonas sp.]|jgi:RecA-family ATPase|uniref:AAA family ATPase n=1 Tax=Brevundimonas sp. TaxID=1871086 RepID=UPI00391EF03B